MFNVSGAKMNDLRKNLETRFSAEHAAACLAATFGSHWMPFGKAAIDRDPKGLYAVSRAGQIHCSGGKRAEVLYVEVLGDTAIRRNRASLRKSVDSYFSAEDEVSGVLAFFHKRNEDAWRLSWAYKKAARNDAGKFAVTATETIRCTYALGPGTNVLTPALRLDALSKIAEPSLADIEAAFSVEAVGEEFFKEYRRFYDLFSAEIAKPRNRKLFGLGADGDLDPHSAEAKPLRDFAKKLLGRLVFLKFLEKKGWLGATEYRKADGRKDFLYDLFKAHRAEFYAEALVPLFFETLNRPRADDRFSLTGTKIPFLNGGLFEPDYDVEAVNRKLTFPGGLFEELLQFFSRYNFTVDEHDEGDAEIGVDPEMLGRIFERLIEDNEKDKNGTIYTPYAVVEFMCRNALLLRLCRELGSEREDKKGIALKKLLTDHDSSGLTEKDIASAENAAKSLKVLDPAVGSGAFPLGMLKELVSLRETIAERRGEKADRERLKREIIRSTLYGVDLDPGAVDIARLRLFLALVVDAAEPEPLPNLDFKLMQGDSLAEAWEDVPVVFDMKEYRAHRVKESDGLFETGELERLNQRKRKSAAQILKESGEDVVALLDDYYDPSGSPEQKRESREKIEALELYTVRHALESERSAKAAALRKAEETDRLKKTPASAKAAERAAAELARVDAFLADFDVLENGTLRDKPYFLWHYYFHDAFESGGFDIIIGNPPYRANQENENDRAKNRAYPLIDARIKETFVAKSTAQKTKCYDLFARFFRLAMDFSLAGKKESLVAFITNYAFIDARTYDGFRKDVRESFGRMFVVNLGGDVRANPKLSGPVNSIFGIQAGVAVSFTEPRKKNTAGFTLLYAATEEEATRQEKIAFIESDTRAPLPFARINPDPKETWIKQTDSDFDTLIPLCSKDGKFERGTESTIFKLFSMGIITARDEWLYDTSATALGKKVAFFIEEYKTDVRLFKLGEIDGYSKASKKIKYTTELIAHMEKGNDIKFSESKIIENLYRPFVKMCTFYDEILTHRRNQMPKIFPLDVSLKKPKANEHIGNNKIIAILSVSSGHELATLSSTMPIDYCLLKSGNGGTFCLSLFSYRNGSQFDNITDWALAHFRNHYSSSEITKLDIFHYVYAVLHNPAYRLKYAQDLKRDYPRIPLYADFRRWADWGKALMEMHVEFESQDEAEGIVLYPGDGKTTKTHKADYVTDDHGHRSYTGTVRFSDGSILSGIPPRAFEYRLGNKSAIEWVLDQYSERHWPSDEDIAKGKAKPLREDEKVLRDRFNAYRFADYKEHVISLIKKLVGISLATLDIQEKMSELETHGVDARAAYTAAVDDEAEAAGAAAEGGE